LTEQSRQQEGSGMSSRPIAAASVTSAERPHGAGIDSGGHTLRGDAPGGRGDAGHVPRGRLLAGLGVRPAITLRMYAERKQRPVIGVDVELSYLVQDRSTRWIDRTITLRGPLDDDQRPKLAEIAEKTPVTEAVRAGTEIRTTLEEVDHVSDSAERQRSTGRREVDG
jgi:putative redox protein